MQKATDFLEISKEVKEALESNKPVVALESTIISHGMPWPENYETALEVEKVVRNKGCIPATIAIILGQIKIGLSEDELEQFAQSKDVLKLSKLDLPFAIHKKSNGATTVAATMYLANLAGIQVFATGGIGGVHRGFDKHLDISADLTELAQTSVAVVCAGIKSILDIPATVEHLETLGVPIVGYQSKELAAFYSRESGVQVPITIDSAEAIAKFLSIKWQLGLQGGVVISNPIPKPFSMDAVEINTTIERALKEAENKGIQGKKITPFLLNQIKELTQGKSLQANIALIKNNAALAADIAKNLAG